MRGNAGRKMNERTLYLLSGLWKDSSKSKRHYTYLWKANWMISLLAINLGKLMKAVNMVLLTLSNWFCKIVNWFCFRFLQPSYEEKQVYEKWMIIINKEKHWYWRKSFLVEIRLKPVKTEKCLVMRLISIHWTNHHEMNAPSYCRWRELVQWSNNFKDFKSTLFLIKVKNGRWWIKSFVLFRANKTSTFGTGRFFHQGETTIHDKNI